MLDDLPVGSGVLADLLLDVHAVTHTRRQRACIGERVAPVHPDLESGREAGASVGAIRGGHDGSSRRERRLGVLRAEGLGDGADAKLERVARLAAVGVDGRGRHHGRGAGRLEHHHGALEVDVVQQVHVRRQVEHVVDAEGRRGRRRRRRLRVHAGVHAARSVRGTNAVGECAPLPCGRMPASSPQLPVVPLLLLLLLRAATATEEDDAHLLAPLGALVFEVAAHSEYSLWRSLVFVPAGCTCCSLVNRFLAYNDFYCPPFADFLRRRSIDQE